MLSWNFQLESNGSRIIGAVALTYVGGKQFVRQKAISGENAECGYDKSSGYVHQTEYR